MSRHWHRAPDVQTPAPAQTRVPFPRFAIAINLPAEPAVQRRSQRRARRQSAGAWRMMTLVPTGTRLNRSATSELTSRKQPDDTAMPMVLGMLVPWMR